MVAREAKSIPNKDFIPEVGTLVKDGKDVTIIVRGNSMNPAMIDKRDKITFSPFEEGSLKKGVIVLAMTKELGYVAHRVIKREGNLLILKGDGNSRGIEHTDVKNVLGVATHLIRKNRDISLDSTGWRLYSAIWMALSPFRRYILWLWRKINL